jgi:hypothetical protein
METIIAEAAGIAKEASSLYQLAALLIICACRTVAFWLYTKKALARSCEAELARTAQRKAERDKEMTELRGEIGKVYDKAEGVGRSFDRHLDCHKDADNKSQRTFDELGRKFGKLQSNVHDMDKRVIEIHTIIKERFR